MINLEKHREYNRKSYWKYKTIRDIRAKEYQNRAKEEVISHYSRGTNACACCGVTGLIFLTVDHINGDGAKKRKAKQHKTGKMFYIWLRSHAFPQGFQILCHNCNQAKKQLSMCPHKLLVQPTK